MLKVSKKPGENIAYILLNCSNLTAPKALVKTFEKMHVLNSGDFLQVIATDPYFEPLVTNWSINSGYFINKVIKNQSQMATIIQNKLTPTPFSYSNPCFCKGFFYV